MGKGPSTPSPGETAAANKETAKYNTEMSFVDQYTPYGSYTYTRLPGTQVEKTRDVLDYYVDEAGNRYNDKGKRDDWESTGYRKPVYKQETYYEADPDAAPRYRLDVKLSPEEQQKLDLLNAVQIGLGNIGTSQLDRVASAMSNPVDFSKYGEISGPSYKWRRNT